MRRFFTLMFTICALSSHAQYFWSENFDYTADPYLSHFVIDTTYHSNIWQIGKPQKVVFDSALSYPNAIVTDTLNPYPPNDTSVFVVKQYFMPGPPIMSLNFLYKLDIDSGVIAKVEVSGDNGSNWINMITEDTTYLFYWGATKPRMDTSVLSWQYFQINMETWVNAYPGGPDSFPHYRTSDTLLFRFTFISTSDTTSKDGWIMDNFYIENAIMEGAVSVVNKNEYVSVYPVPSDGAFYIHSSDPSLTNAAINIYDVSGRNVYKGYSTGGNTFLNLQLPAGCYYLRYGNGKDYAIKKLIIR